MRFVRLATRCLLVLAFHAMSVSPPANIGQLRVAVPVLYKHDKPVPVITRTLALSFEAIVVAPVDVLGDFLDIPLRVHYHV